MLRRGIFSSGILGGAGSNYNSFGFDNVDDFVGCGVVIDSTAMATQPYTYSAWINTTDTSQEVIMACSDGSTSSFLFHVNLLAGTVGAANKLSVGYFNSGWTGQFLTSTTSVNTGAWFHVAATYDGASGLEIFVNGVSEGTLTMTSPPANGSSANTNISTSADPWNGGITQPQIYDVVLNSIQIETLYNLGKPKLYSILPTSITDDCILSYAMNSNDNSLTDQSTAGNDGTANGGVTSDGPIIEWDNNPYEFLLYTHTWHGDADIQSNEADVDGNGDAITIPNSTNFDLVADDFTYETIMNFDALPQDFPMLFSKWGSAGARSFQFLYRNDTNALRLAYTTDGSTVLGFDSSWTPTLGVEYHIAFCRDGSDLRIFVDGVQIGATHNISTGSIFTGTQRLVWGAYDDPTGSFQTNGYVDGQFNYSKLSNVALYTAGFTAPTTLSNDLNTVYLNTYTGANGSTPTNNTE